MTGDTQRDDQIDTGMEHDEHALFFVNTNDDGDKDDDDDDDDLQFNKNASDDEDGGSDIQEEEDENVESSESEENYAAIFAQTLQQQMAQENPQNITSNEAANSKVV